MKNTLLKILTLVASLFIIIAVAGYIKFNYFDIPYLGDPITYLSEKGEPIVVSGRVDGSIQLEQPNDPRTILTHIKSGSGEKYENEDKSLIFWRKGEEFILKKSGEIIFQGTAAK